MYWDKSLYQAWIRQPNRKKGTPSTGKRLRDTPNSYCWESHKNSKLYHHKARYRVCVCHFSLCELLWALLNWFCRSCSCGIFIPSGSYNYFFPFFCEVPLIPPSVCIWVSASATWVAGWSLYDDDLSRQWSVNIEYRKIPLEIISLIFFVSCFWFYPKSLGYPAPCSWPSRQCQTWVPSHGLGFMLNPALADHTH